MNELIKTRRKELNITLEEIGDYVGVSKATVQRWETGNISNMRRDRIKKLSEILQLDADVLLGINGNTEGVSCRIPVLNSVMPGIPVKAQEDIVGYEEVPAELARNKVLFGLKIKGDSMEPRIFDGDIVIVKQQNNIKSSETAVVMVGAETLCRRVVKHNNGILLVPNNPKYEPMFFAGAEIEQLPVKIVGKVIELRAKF